MKKISVVAMLALVPLFAQADGRIKVIEYSPDAVVNINVNHYFATQVVLDDGERITDVVGGDTDGWIVSSRPGDRFIYLKPKSSARPSNLIVTSNLRSYVFSLNVLQGMGRGVWQVVFKYQKPAEVINQQLLDEIAIKERLKEKQPVINWSYTMQAGSKSDGIVPSEMYDDGRFTYIRISGGREIPAVFRINADGSESLVNKHMEGRDQIVLHEINKRYVLRLGEQVVGLWNEKFDAEGRPPEEWTISDRVTRSVKGVE